VARDWLARPATAVAPQLLGCVLEHETAEGLVAVRLTEVEAYAGAVDPASHSYRGRTRRNTVMFGPPGHAYVYFTYGMHFCVNIVCQLPGIAEAVLLRAGEVIMGENLARQRRTRRADAQPIPARELARGPARLCQAMAITRVQDGTDVCAQDSPLRLLAGQCHGQAQEVPPISVGPRVGVSAGAEANWRYWLTNDPTVSAYRAHQRRPGKAS
jgi:DNA-3-methyladenine glycosylase